MLASKGFRSFSRLTGPDWHLPPEHFWSRCATQNRAARLSTLRIPELPKSALSDMHLPSQGQHEMPFHRRRSRDEAGKSSIDFAAYGSPSVGRTNASIYSSCRSRPVAERAKIVL